MSRLRLGLFVTALLAGCQSTPGPDTIVYEPATASINERAVAAMLDCFATPGCEALLGDNLQCGPFLWREIKDHPAVTDIAQATQYVVPEQTQENSTRKVPLEGRRFQGAGQVRAFWKAFTDTFPLETHERIRMLGDEEIRIYWTLIRTKIQEPVYMVYGKNSRILMQLAGVRHRLTLMFIDDFQSVAIRE